jgi:GrpB-like predicted nucleotidyltransferase (UPF0157 family)
VTATHPLWRPFDIPTAAEVAAARVRDHVAEQVVVTEPDPAWPGWFARVADRVRGALGERVLSLDHVGSTAVPGLPAKPVVDADLVVAASADEEAWLPALEAVGFELRVREPAWEEHRVVKGQDPVVNLHVWSPGSQEVQRHLAFRDWLRTHADDRAAYGEVKRRITGRHDLDDAMAYNNLKAAFVYDLYERIFAADPAYPHDPHPRPE